MLAHREPLNIALGLAVFAMLVASNGLWKFLKFRRRPLRGIRPPKDPIRR